MDDLEKVETIRTKCNVSYTDAKAALDAADGNVLDALTGGFNLQIAWSTAYAAGSSIF